MLEQQVDKLLAGEEGVAAIEKNLFKEAILLQQKTLDRTPSTFQISQSWKRWKRERGIDKDAEGDFNDTDLYHK